MKKTQFIVFLNLFLFQILLSGKNCFSQCETCQSYHIVVYNTNVTVPQPVDSASFVGWTYLKNHCVIRLKQSIRENEINPDCIHIYDGSFILQENGNTSFNSQNIAPLGSLPVTSGCHYLIRSEAVVSGDGFNVTFYLETGQSREVVMSFERTFRDFSELGFSGNDLGKAAGFQAFSPLSMIIRSFETRKREEDKGIAIEANPIEVLPHAKSIKKEEKVTVAFRLTDCDGEVLPGRKILLHGGSAIGETLVPPTLGQFEESEVVTDDKGVAKATFVAGRQKGKANIRVYYTYTAPFGEERYTSGEATVDIEGDPVTALIGEIEVNATTKTGNPTISSPETSKSVAQIFTVSSLNLTIIPERIKSINKSKEVLQTALTETDQFEVVSGKTMVNEGGEPTIVRAESTYSQYDLCDGKLEVCRSGKIKGYSNGFDISVGIALERGVETGNMTISSLSPKYCLLVRLGSNSRQLFQTAKYKTSGDDKGQKRDYPCADLTSFSEPLDPKATLPFEGISSTIRVNDTENHEFIVPMSIANSKQLEQYLLNPQGIFTIVTNGTYIKRDYEEKEIKVHSKLMIWPKDQESN